MAKKLTALEELDKCLEKGNKAKKELKLYSNGKIVSLEKLKEDLEKLNQLENKLTTDKNNYLEVKLIDAKIKKETISEEPQLLGDMRTLQVKRNDIKYRFKDKIYVMSTFTGLVTKIEKINTLGNRAKITIELQNGKRLSFFATIDEYLKENAIIEVVGICEKQGKFYHFNCKRRISKDIDQSGN